ncbi:P-loop containing nucleoside triphosphate hydrolase protein [Byssothecium circinans]|uniref:P-loop containing nucleoside triphosphate hydrolase protein n=1 Tax=Byssothecium circinans TaxID=147558 RepID=A0A6A5TLR8_9PLEO|nr:P-loop containing nucleoside triphosphate hydrolase protein [Byssothecium circinans]
MEPIQAIPGHAHPLMGGQLADDASDIHLLDDSEPESQHSICRDSQWDGHVDLASLSLHQGTRNMGLVRQSFLRQILGLNPFKSSYLSLYRPLDDSQSRCILFLGFVLAVAAGVPLPLIGVILGKIINNFPPDEDDLRTRLIQLMATAVAFFVVTWGWSVCWAIIGERVSRRTRERLVERALGMDQTYFDTVSPDMTNILTARTQTIQLGTSEKVGLFIASISYFVAAFTVGFILNARLTGVLFVSVIPSMTLIVILGTKYISRFAKQADSFTEQATAVAESAFRGVQIVQAFGVSRRLAQDHIEFLRKALRAGIKKSIIGALMLGGIYFVAYAANALAFWYGDRIRQGSAEAGTIYAVVFLILDASFVVGQVGPFIQTFALAAAAGQSVFDILDHPTADIDVYSAEGKVLQRSDFEQDIKLQDVTFVYPARPTERVLEGVDLTIPSGKVTGLVGPSGSGKSTMAALLLRLYDPPTGKVKLGDVDLRNINIKSLRSHIALVTQSPVLFTGTILENIMLGIPEGEEVTEEEAIARCNAAAGDAYCNFLEHLPDGVNTKIGSGHHSLLSGGQKQRICLARALVGNPSILILDEYTSALDATSEAAVLENLRRSSATSGRTTIVIAHRLATVKDADRIIVMKDGAVTEAGSHDDLVRANGLYSELIRAQQFDKKHTQSTTSTLVSGAESLHHDATQVTKAPQATSSTDSLAPGEPAKKGTGELISRSLSLSRAEAPAIAIGLLASLASGGITVGEALVFGSLVELLNDTSNSPQLASKISLYCLLFFVLAVVALISRSCGGGAFGLVSENLVLRVRDVSFKTILVQDIAWFSKPGHSHHNLMSTLNMDSGHISGLSGVILGTFFSIATSVIGGIILAHIVAWKIAIVLLAAVPVMLFAGFFRLRILAKAEERHQTAYNSAAAIASEACAAIQTVAALGRERHFFQKYRAAIQGPYQEGLKFSILGNIMLAFSLSITYFVYALAYWWGSKQVRSGAYTQRDFFIVLPALLFSAQAAGQLFSLAPEITRAKTAAQSIFALHDEKPSIITNQDLTLPDDNDNTTATLLDNHTTPGSTGELEFRGVSLYYATRPDVAALRDVSFSIRSGEYVAFVGRSGAGKSSTVHLIERFFDPSSGEVLLDGQDIRKGDVQAHRARLGLVEQEPDLFPGSVKFNIGLGAKPGVEVSEDDIVAVAKKCELHDFIMSLPEGYNTEVGAHGSKLSGGQRQRLAIARALIRNPEVLLLDEATSQLDANTEREIRRAIAAASKGRTTIMIAHRLASVQHADRIFVFDNGTIVEQGRHDDLVAFGGIYAGMVAAQELD